MKANNISSSAKRIFWKLPYELRRVVYGVVFREQAGILRRQRVEQVSGITFAPALSKKCIFVHVPKAAGSSICQAIYGGPGGRHSTARQYQLALTEQEWTESFKFAFVRNPWDRLLSAYRYLTLGKVNARDKRWVLANLTEYRNFSDFVRHFLNRQTLMVNHVLRPQHFYVCTTKGEIAVDFLGRYESLEADFQHVLEMQGQPPIDLPYLNASGPGVDFRKHYSDRDAEKVAELYDEDIRLFDYRF